jgi:hypothetical protein
MQLAAYVDQQISGSARDAIETHVADCDFCLSQVSFLTESADWQQSADVPAQLLSRARNLVAQKPDRALSWGWRWAAATAVACFVLFVVVFALQWRGQRTVPPETGPLVAQQRSPELVPSPPIYAAPPVSHSGPSPPVSKPRSIVPAAPTVRSKTTENFQPELIFPREGGLLLRGELEFRWEPVSEAIFYEVRVMSADGNLVFEGQTEDIKLKPGLNLSLLPGQKYFVSVRAHLRQDKTTKSRVVGFQVSE